MNRQKTAAFLADCLGHMPPQPDEVKVVISGLKRIADGGEWPKSDALAAADAAYDAAARAAADAADWATAHAAYWAAAYAARAANWAAYAAARAHPDPAKERARQAKAREEMGL